jgi:hypothetical protein
VNVSRVTRGWAVMGGTVAGALGPPVRPEWGSRSRTTACSWEKS